jgi:hypothetical protein
MPASGDLVPSLEFHGELLVQYPDFSYILEDYDVPEVRRAVLGAFRLFRRKCLTYFHGDADASVMNQVRGFAWYTAVYRTLE